MRVGLCSSRLTSPHRHEELCDFANALFDVSEENSLECWYWDESPNRDDTFHDVVIVSGYGSVFGYSETFHSFGDGSVFDDFENGVAKSADAIIFIGSYFPKQKAIDLASKGTSVFSFGLEGPDDYALLLTLLTLELVRQGFAVSEAYMWLVAFLLKNVHSTEKAASAISKSRESYYFTNIATGENELTQISANANFASLMQDLFGLDPEYLSIDKDSWHQSKTVCNSISIDISDAEPASTYLRKSRTWWDEEISLRFTSGIRASRHDIRIPESDHVDVYFYTNRRHLNDKWQSEVADSPSFGKAVVMIPSSYRIGRQSALNFLGIRFFAPRLPIDDVRVVTKNKFVNDLKSDGVDSEKTVVCYVHGYNTSFDECITEAAQLRYDIAPHLPFIAFSWPSKASKLDYVADTTTVNLSMQSFSEFLRTVINEAECDKLIVIAHSLGSRLVVGGVQHALSADEAVQLSEVLLVAPDIDQREIDLYKQSISIGAGRSTVYASMKDRALDLSHWLGGHQRVGHAPPRAVRDYYDYIDVTPAVQGFLRHSYHLTELPVLMDIRDLIDGKNVQKRRLTSFPDVGERYYQLSP